MLIWICNWLIAAKLLHFESKSFILKYFYILTSLILLLKARFDWNGWYYEKISWNQFQINTFDHADAFNLVVDINFNFLGLFGISVITLQKWVVIAKTRFECLKSYFVSRVNSKIWWKSGIIRNNPETGKISGKES